MIETIKVLPQILPFNIRLIWSINFQEWNLIDPPSAVITLFTSFLAYHRIVLAFVQPTSRVFIV